jgi:outer membrane protein assembly factor BamA
VDFWANPSTGNVFSLRRTEMFRDTDEGSSHDPITEIDLTHYEPLGHNWVVAASMHGRDNHRHDLLDYDAFELGGSKNLRGFPESFFRGYRVGWGTLEMRYLTARTSRVFLFLDSGYVEQLDTGITRRLEELLGYGAGMAIQTRLGVFVLNYALSDNEGEWRSPLDGIVHFGFETQL